MSFLSPSLDGNPKRVTLVEVGPRDGLQNESSSLTTIHKIALIDALTASGIAAIESGSFVSPRLVPAMANSAQVFEGIVKRQGVAYIALIPNLQGLEAAYDAGASQVAVFASASETFSQRNINCSIAQSLVRYRNVCMRARELKIQVRGYLSCVAGCPYEGPVAQNVVVELAEQLLALGCYEVSLGDTIGVGTPGLVARLLETITKRIPAEKLAVHFHDTWGQALANILVALEAGISVVDTSVAGLGGCPFAPGAGGNVATEDVLYMLNGMNVRTGVDLDKVAAAGLEICALLGRKPASRALLAWSALQKRSDSM